MVWLSFRAIFSDFSGNVCMLRAKHMLEYISKKKMLESVSVKGYFFIKVTCLWNKSPQKHPTLCPFRIAVYSFHQAFLEVLLLIQKQLGMLIQALCFLLNRSALPSLTLRDMRNVFSSISWTQFCSRLGGSLLKIQQWLFFNSLQ